MYNSCKWCTLLFHQLDQYDKDVVHVESKPEDILPIIHAAANDVYDAYMGREITFEEKDFYYHQVNPLSEYKQQLLEIEKQQKKIFRSRDKLDLLRSHLNEYKSEFEAKFRTQLKTIDDLFEHFAVVKKIVDRIGDVATKPTIENAVEDLSNVILSLEATQGNEILELTPYAYDDVLSFPTNIQYGELIIKTINFQAEVSRWFSSKIYPHIIELEKREELNLERTISTINQVRSKLSALTLSDKEEYDVKSTKIGKILSDLESNSLRLLLLEKEENKAEVELLMYKYFCASQVYKNDILFLPLERSGQIANISKDAIQRFKSTFKGYSDNVKESGKSILSKYIELDKVAVSHFINNKLKINADDDRLSLFMKRGFIGRSFTIKRSDIIDKIVEDYSLWQNKFHGAVLLSGPYGSGKTTILGVISQGYFTEEIIQIKAGESFYTNRGFFDGENDLGKLLDKLSHYYQSGRAIIFIDDLGSWHSNEVSLFRNVKALMKRLYAFGNQFFFVITCDTILDNRINSLIDISEKFTSKLVVGKMSDSNIRTALQSRSGALPDLGLNDTEHENNVGDIVRASKGNIGSALLEYSRYFSKEYEPNILSKEFSQIIKNNKYLLKFILSHGSLPKTTIIKALSELDILEVMDELDYLTGLKILSVNREGRVSVNPLLIHEVEDVLLGKAEQ